MTFKKRHRSSRKIVIIRLLLVGDFLLRHLRHLRQFGFLFGVDDLLFVVIDWCGHVLSESSHVIEPRRNTAFLLLLNRQLLLLNQLVHIFGGAWAFDLGATLIVEVKFAACDESSLIHYGMRVCPNHVIFGYSSLHRCGNRIVDRNVICNLTLWRVIHAINCQQVKRLHLLQLAGPVSCGCALGIAHVVSIVFNHTDHWQCFPTIHKGLSRAFDKRLVVTNRWFWDGSYCGGRHLRDALLHSQIVFTRQRIDVAQSVLLKSNLS